MQYKNSGIMKLLLFLIAGTMIVSSAIAQKSKSANFQKKMDESKYKKAVFGEGCFWCTEAMFTRLKGVKKAVSGYSGGKIANPTYREVCSGLTGHAEATEITYDPSEISFAELLEVFWSTHDPTTLNRQGDTWAYRHSYTGGHSEPTYEDRFILTVIGMTANGDSLEFLDGRRRPAGCRACRPRSSSCSAMRSRSRFCS
jgi:hypothetical protein